MFGRQARQHAQREAVKTEVDQAFSVPNTANLGSFANYYRALPIVRRCITEIADQINSARVTVVDEATRRELMPPRWMAKPSAFFRFSDLVSQCVYMLHAQDRVDLIAQGNPPQAVYVGSAAKITGSDGTKVQVFGGPDSHMFIQPDRVALGHRNAVPGVGSIANAGDALYLFRAAYEAQRLLRNVFTQNMHMDVIFMHEGDYVRDAANELLTQMAKKHAGGQNAFRPIVTDRKFKVDRVRPNNRESQLVELVESTERRIVISVFGIDPIAMGISQASGQGGTSLTYQNASSLRSQQWTRTSAPLARIIEDVVSDFLPEGQRLRFDASDIVRGSPMDRGLLVQNMAQANSQIPEGAEPYFSREEIRNVVGLE